MPYEDQYLLIDADDTLWETNVQYEEANREFARLVEPLGYRSDEVQVLVDRIERKNIGIRGYGIRSFLLSLEEAYVELAGSPARGGDLKAVRKLAQHFGPPRLLAGVSDTLAYLAPRHHLQLFSKGNLEEQTERFQGSGLEGHFDEWTIVPEKNAAAYEEVVMRNGWERRKVWMVGNSPRSDINPALAIGLNAVFIPSALSWSYEQEDIRPGEGTLLHLQRFEELRGHF